MTDTPTPVDAPSLTVADEDASYFGPQKVTQTLVVLMAVISCALFRLGAGLVHWPTERGFSGSLATPVSVGGFLMAMGLLALNALLGTWVLGRRWGLAGLMTAAAGLATWSVRGGTMTYVLFKADTLGIGGRIFYSLAFELVVLMGVIGAIWNYIWARHIVPPIAEEKDKEQGRSAGAAIVAQTGLMALFLLMLIVTPMKKQALAGVFVSALFSTALAQQLFADHKAGRWYWLGPLIVGVCGYVLNASSPTGLEIGNLSGNFAPLGRVLPLDYASVGVAGALMGYWWTSPEEVELDEAAPGGDQSV